MNDLYIYIWLIFIIALVAFEAITAQIVALWFIGGALAALLLAIFNVPFVFQAIAFVVVSIALLFLTKPLVKKINLKNDFKTNAEELTEEVGVVVKSIPMDDIGEVKVKYQTWNAVSENNEPISEGKKVSIVRIEGNKLVVKEKE